MKMEAMAALVISDIEMGNRKQPPWKWTYAGFGFPSEKQLTPAHQKEVEALLRKQGWYWGHSNFHGTALWIWSSSASLYAPTPPGCSGLWLVGTTPAELAAKSTTP